VVRQPAQAASLRLIAEQGTDVLYRGPLGEAIVAASWLEPDDLAAYEPRWVQPLRHGYRGVEVVELPPPTQGVAALEGLALLEGVEPTHGNRVKCARLAVEDALANVRDGVDVEGLLDPDYLERRRRDGPVPVTEPGGGTVYLCAVDADRMAVSFIQSLFASFGSGVVAPGTGIVLQNRGACFAIEGGVRPGARPFHTLIPGLLLRGGKLLGPFGVMGGFIQAQAHLQFVSNLVDGGLDPQAALDRPRFRVDGGLLRLESGLDPAQFQSLGMEVVHEPDPFEFGGGQAVLIDGESLLGGSDSRKDGYAGAL
jgi:gamma-glutamyltranspeptidase/glutathione hydrolase